MSTLTDIRDGVGKYINDANIGVVFKLTGPYANTDIGIYKKRLPQNPDKAIAINVVGQGDDVTLPKGRAMIQLRYRGARNDADSVDILGDSVFGVLHGVTDLICGTVTIIQCNRGSTVPMGADDNQRDERIDQYYIDYSTAPTALRPG